MAKEGRRSERGDLSLRKLADGRKLLVADERPVSDVISDALAKITAGVPPKAAQVLQFLQDTKLPAFQSFREGIEEVAPVVSHELVIPAIVSLLRDPQRSLEMRDRSQVLVGAFFRQDRPEETCVVVLEWTIQMGPSGYAETRFASIDEFEIPKEEARLERALRRYVVSNSADVNDPRHLSTMLEKPVARAIMLVSSGRSPLFRGMEQPGRRLKAAALVRDVVLDIEILGDQSHGTRTELVRQKVLGGNYATALVWALPYEGWIVARVTRQHTELEAETLEDLEEEVAAAAQGLTHETAEREAWAPKDWGEFHAAVDQLQHEAFVITPRAHEACRGNPYPNPARMWWHLNRLAAAARDYRRREGRVETRLQDWFGQEYGIEVAFQDAALGAWKWFEFEGNRYSREPHVKVDDAVHGLVHVGRIYFAIDEEHHRFVVDHIGSKPRT